MDKVGISQEETQIPYEASILNQISFEQDSLILKKAS